MKNLENIMVKKKHISNDKMKRLSKSMGMLESIKPEENVIYEVLNDNDSSVNIEKSRLLNELAKMNEEREFIINKLLN